MKQPRGLALQALQNLGTTPAAHGANFPCADADTDTYPDLDTDTDTWMWIRERIHTQIVEIRIQMN